jgi:hypothetical protein
MTNCNLLIFTITSPLNICYAHSRDATWRFGSLQMEVTAVAVSHLAVPGRMIPGTYRGAVSAARRYRERDARDEQDHARVTVRRLRNVAGCPVL